MTPVPALDVVSEGLVGPVLGGLADDLWRSLVLCGVWSVRAYLVVVGRALELETRTLDVDIDFAECIRFHGDPADMRCDLQS